MTRGNRTPFAPKRSPVSPAPATRNVTPCSTQDFAGEGRFFSPEDKQLAVRKLSADERARLPLVFLEKPEDLSARYEITADPADGCTRGAA